MYIFLDDIRDPPSDAVRHSTAEEALNWLASGQITRISFDHDRGQELSGYDVAKKIEDWVAEGKFTLPRWEVHSANRWGGRILRLRCCPSNDLRKSNATPN